MKNTKQQNNKLTECTRLCQWVEGQFSFPFLTATQICSCLLLSVQLLVRALRVFLSSLPSSSMVCAYVPSFVFCFCFLLSTRARSHPPHACPQKESTGEGELSRGGGGEQSAQIMTRKHAVSSPCFSSLIFYPYYCTPQFTT